MVCSNLISKSLTLSLAPCYMYCFDSLFSSVHIEVLFGCFFVGDVSSKLTLLGTDLFCWHLDSPEGSKENWRKYDERSFGWQEACNEGTAARPVQNTQGVSWINFGVKWHEGVGHDSLVERILQFIVWLFQNLYLGPQFVFPVGKCKSSSKQGSNRITNVCFCDF